MRSNTERETCGSAYLQRGEVLLALYFPVDDRLAVVVFLHQHLDLDEVLRIVNPLVHAVGVDHEVAVEMVYVEHSLPVSIEGPHRPCGQPTESLHEVVRNAVALPKVQVAEVVVPVGQLEVENGVDTAVALAQVDWVL